MRIKSLSFLLIFFISIPEALPQSAQKKIDSLMQVAESANDSVRLRIYNRVSFYYIFNNPEKAKNLMLKGIKQAEAKKVYFSEAELVNTYGIYYDVSGKSDSAKYYFEKALNLSEMHGYKVITAMVINNLGMFHWNKGSYEEALDYFFQALEMNKENTVDSGDGTYLNNIGLIYLEMGQYEKAEEYHKKALEVRKRYGDKKDIATSLSNLAIVLGVQDRNKESEQMFLEAMDLAKSENEQGRYFDVLNGLSKIYLKLNDPKKAIQLLEELIKGRNEHNINRRSNLVAISRLIKIYNGSNNLNLALKYVEMGDQFLDEFPDSKNSVVEFFQNASETYFRNNNPLKGAEYLEKAISTKEEIFSTENANTIANLETKFNVAEKERDLAETRAKLTVQELEVERKNILVYGTSAAAIFIGVLGFLVYHQQKLKNSQLKKEAELKTALAKIEIQNRLQEQRLRISRDLHDNIGSQLTFIISSIDSLKYRLSDAGSAITDKLGSISSFTSQTIHELRDTIWAMNKADISVEDLQARISNFIEKASDSSEVDFQFHVDESLLNNCLFTSVEGMNIYRVIQEAVNNAIKHSGASQIQVSLSKNLVHTAMSNYSYKIEIVDNGKGFDVEKAELGNGIENIKKRAKDLNGKVEVVSETERGTTVKLVY